MLVDVTAQARIEAAPAVVAAVQFDPQRDPDWIGGVDKVEMITPPPLAQGSEVRRLGAFMGRRIEWVMRVEAIEPAARVAMHALRSPFPMDVEYRLEPLEGGRATRASIRIQGEARGMYALAGPLTGTMVRRSVTGDLQRLKRIVEATPTGTR